MEFVIILCTHFCNVSYLFHSVHTVASNARRASVLSKPDPSIQRRLFFWGGGLTGQSWSKQNFRKEGRLNANLQCLYDFLLTYCYRCAVCSVNIGPVHLISFNSEYYYFVNYGWQQIARQYEWLERDLRVSILYPLYFLHYILQCSIVVVGYIIMCFDAVVWVAGKASGL